MTQPAIGIDLGTTYSALAAINHAGKPEIVANKEGERVTASAVYFRENAPILVGQPAAESAPGDPERVARWIKLKMGDADWRFEVDGKSYTAVDISAMILRKVRQDAETVLGPIKHAVVTVPAYFDEVRRKATMDAAAKAGLEVLRIINEPTAAALAYAIGGRVRGKVLIYDFGGGTFDVSIVNIQPPDQVTVIASEGDHELGGYHLDKLLAGHFDRLFRAEHGGVGLMDGKDSEAAGRKYLTIANAEKAKRRLSSMMTVSGVLLTWGGHSMNVSVDRSTFEDLIGDYLVRTEMLVENALFSAGLSAREIDSVVLVGGSIRIPAVQRMLQKKFQKEPVRYVNPDEAVALGAAIQAGILMQDQGLINLPAPAAAALSRTRLQDVTSHSFGTFALCEVDGCKKERNTIILPRNTQIPCSKTRSFSTLSPNQRAVSCEVTQGEGEDPAFVNVIWEEDFELPPGRPAGCEIRANYSYDANGRMACEFLDVESGRTLRVTLDMAAKSGMTPAVPELDEVSFDDLVIE